MLALVAKAHTPFVCEVPVLQDCSNKFVSMFASAFRASHFSMSAFLMTPHFQYSSSVHPLAIVVYMRSDDSWCVVHDNRITQNSAESGFNPPLEGD